MNLRQKLERILYTNLDLHPSWCRRCRGTITPFYRPYKVLLWIPNSCERGWNLPSVYERRKPVLISPDTQTHKISGTGQRKPSNNASQTVTQCEVHSVLCNIMFCGKWTVFFPPTKVMRKRQRQHQPSLRLFPCENQFSVHKSTAMRDFTKKELVYTLPDIQLTH